MKAPWLWRKDGIAAGYPCIRGTGISTDVVYARWQAGEGTNYIANDYTIPREAVIAAIAYELGRRHKRTREWREALEYES